MGHTEHLSLSIFRLWSGEGKESAYPSANKWAVIYQDKSPGKCAPEKEEKREKKNRRGICAVSVRPSCNIDGDEGKCADDGRK